jgi:predicted RNA binding protein YcfA (HicA-like mRNA interferase family)
MPRITPISWKVFDCILLKAGFYFSRKTGGHRIYSKEGCIRPIVVPEHSKKLAKTVILSCLQSAGISRKEYFKLLKEC